MMQATRLLSASTRRWLIEEKCAYSPMTMKVQKEITGTLNEVLKEILHDDETETLEYRQNLK